MRGKERKNAELCGFCQEKCAFAPSALRLCGGMEDAPADAHNLWRKTRESTKKRGKERKNAEMRGFAQKCRVRAVCPAAVRRDGGCARQCALFAVKNAEKSEKTQNCAAFARKMRVCTVCPVAVRRDEEIAHRCAQFALKNAEKSEKTRNCAVFARKRRVCAVCPVAVRRDEGIARRCAQFALENAEKSEKTRLCSVLLSFARKFEFLQHITVARPEQ